MAINDIGSMPFPSVPASASYTARLQVGRLVSNPLLAIVVMLRTLLLMLVTGSWDSGPALAWVVLQRRETGTEVGRLSAGRQAGAGEHLLAAVEDSLREMARTTTAHRPASVPGR